MRAAATALDLDFIPLVWEQYDVVLSAAALAAAESFISALLDPAVRQAIDQLGGYDTTGAGDIRSLPEIERADQ